MADEIEIRRRKQRTGLVVEEHFLVGTLVRRMRFSEGQLLSDMQFGEHGWPLGLAREWYRTGELKRERWFDRDTAVTGELRTWHRTGKLKERRHRENRQWVGLHEKFYPDGHVRMSGHWELGMRPV